MRKQTPLGKRLRKDPTRLFYPAPTLERLPVKEVTGGELFKLRQTWSYNPKIYYEDMVKSVKDEVGHDETYRYVLKKTDKQIPKVDKHGWIQPDPKDFVSVDVYRTYFYHLYNVDSFHPSANKRHACLSSGYWCWSNLRERPFDIISYIQNKCKKLTRKNQ